MDEDGEEGSSVHAPKLRHMPPPRQQLGLRIGIDGKNNIVGVRFIFETSVALKLAMCCASSRVCSCNEL
jgi:hypothetical protein